MQPEVPVKGYQKHGSLWTSQQEGLQPKIQQLHEAEVQNITKRGCSWALHLMAVQMLLDSKAPRTETLLLAKYHVL